MSKSKEVSIKEHFKNLIRAIYALLPSRNMVSQLIMLLPLKEESVEELFPEITEDIEYWEMFKAALGLRSYEGNVETSYYGYAIANALKDFINRVFEILSNEGNRAAISSLLGELIPNAEREWLEVRVKSVLENPSVSNVAKKVLMLLAENPNVNIKELPTKLKIREQDVENCLYVLSNLKLVEISGENISLPYSVKSKHISYIKKLLRGKGYGQG